MPVVASSLPVTVATVTMTVFALAISRGNVVPRPLLGVVGSPVPVVGMGSKWLTRSSCVHFWLRIGIYLHVCGKIWVGVAMHVEVPSPVTRTFVPSPITVAGGSMVTPRTMTLTPTSGVGSRRGPGTHARFEPARTGFRLEIGPKAWIHHRPPPPPAISLLFSV